MQRQNLLVKAATLALIGFIFGAVGCEDNGGSDYSNHDFGDNDPNLIVAFGDSITHGFGLSTAESYPSQLAAMTGRPVINSGVDGQKSGEGLDRVNSVLNRFKPGFLLILFGSNDLEFDISGEQITENLRGIIQAAKANKTVPIVATVPHAFPYHDFIEGSVEALDPMIKAMASEEGVPVADAFSALSDPTLFQSDGLHPNAAGAVKLAATFNDKL